MNNPADRVVRRVFNCQIVGSLVLRGLPANARRLTLIFRELRHFADRVGAVRAFHALLERREVAAHGLVDRAPGGGGGGSLRRNEQRGSSKSAKSDEGTHRILLGI